MMKKVFIAIPAYDSKIYALGMVSVFNNIEVLKKNGIESTFSLQMGDCYVDQTRNHLVRSFLASDCTDMIFVDNDLAFDGDAMLKILRPNVQVIGGAYPYRSEDKDDYPVAIKLDDKNFPVIDKDKGLIECTHVPTGLMRIRRDVFDVLTKKYPDNIDDSGELIHFRTGLLFADKGDKRWYGEDVYFCKICDDVGIKVWCDPTIAFAHIGTLTKKGRYADFLRNGGVAKKG
jgi:hypothetical protein